MPRRRRTPPEDELHRIQRDRRSADDHTRETAELQLHVWRFKDALSRGDEPAMDRAWADFRGARRRLGYVTDPSSFTTALMLRLLAAAGRIGDAAQDLLRWYPAVETEGVEEDNTRRTHARQFVSGCLVVLTRPASIGHPDEAALTAALRDVAARIKDVLTTQHEDDLRLLSEIRGLHAAGTALDATRSRLDGLPPTGDPVADAALAALDDHDDTGPVDQLLRTPGRPADLRCLLRARRALALGRVREALTELRAAPDGPLLPQLRATLGRALVLADDANLDEAVAVCAAGRRAGLRGRSRVTAADTSLARLLGRRALREDRPPDDRADDIENALALARRRCRPWHHPSPDDKVVLLDVRAVRGAMLGDGRDDSRRRAFRRSVAAAGSVAQQARLAAAWAGWAVRSGDAEAAAEAYEQLIALVPRDAAARRAESGRDRVLAAAQEHTEEAGYWLARAHRYREAVVALETGRAIGLSEAMRADTTAALGYPEISAAAGDGALVYLAAARAGGYALVVAGGHDPQFVALPELSRATVGELVELAIGSGHPGTRDLGAAGPAPDAIDTVLQTLWRSGIQQLVWQWARGRIVTFVPVGLLGLLPVHAAQAPPDVSDGWHAGVFSAIRYAPNARSLRRCRQIAGELPPGRDRLLAVDVPAGRGGGAQLRHVTRETLAVADAWSAAGVVRHHCTWPEFLDAAGAQTVWHLACHGSSRPYDILGSRLSFADREVTLAELRRELRPGRRRLAVLSACESNLSGAALPNEVVGLPSALLELGFAGVVASSWKVDDLATAYLMTAFHRRWRDGAEPAVALNQAQSWLRAASRADLVELLPGTDPGPGEPCPYAAARYWAAFAYTGA